MATTVVSVVIFLCGVLVGRGVRAERGEDPTIVTAAQPAEPATGPVAAEAPTPPTDTPLSYDKRLRDEGKAQETLKPADPAANLPAAKPEPVLPDPPAPVAAKPAPAEPPATAAVDKPEPPTTGPRPGNWVIQVHALQNRDAANAFVRSLKAKGYPA